jgi:CRISPR/Cas system-associated endonuclease Cas1
MLVPKIKCWRDQKRLEEAKKMLIKNVVNLWKMLEEEKILIKKCWPKNVATFFKMLTKHD